MDDISTMEPFERERTDGFFFFSDRKTQRKRQTDTHKERQRQAKWARGWEAGEDREEGIRKG